MQRIIIADYNAATKSFHDTQSIAVPPEIVGYLYFDENTDICIINNNILQKYNNITKTFEVSTINNTASARRLANLFECVNKQWGDTSMEYINCVNWTNNQIPKH